MILLYSLIKCTKDLSVLLLSPACESAVVSIETNKQTKNTSNKRKDKPDWEEIFTNYFIKDQI